ncbi:glycosyltransferase [Spongisporangium articulatum]|uniref:Glycosyltransferase n=1 Tax=Spongisporangium articulatum TaxID=3362603 RepID=A0ABW8AQY1_9ACTN
MSLDVEHEPRDAPGSRSGVSAPALITAEPGDLAPVVLPEGWRPPVPAQPSVRVTAVLVAHDGVAFLPRTLDALDAQTRRPDVLVAVDAGSHDNGPDLLRLATDHLLRLERDTSFGDAVQAALAVRDGLAMQPQADPRPDDSAPAPDEKPSTTVVSDEWLWLLHDDSAPAPDCLAQLLDAVDSGPSIGIAGCKQVSWDDPRRLLDVGFTTSRLGTRVTGVDRDDLDQGQLDHRSDVMAVNTAGMLIRRELWDALGGPDPALGHARGDLDLCRRAHLSGARVVVVPDAVVAHAEAAATGRRGAGAGHWARHDRRAAVHLRLAAAPRWAVPCLLIWLGLAAVARALGRLALKQPDRAFGELSAYCLAVVHPIAWLRPRRGPRVPRREFRRLLAGPREIGRQRREEVSAYLRRSDERADERADDAAPAGAPLTSPAGSVSSLPAPTVSPDSGPIDLSADEARPDAEPGSELELLEVDEDGVPSPAHAVEAAAQDLIRRRRRGPRTSRVLGGVLLLCAVGGLAGLRGLLVGSGAVIGPALSPVPESVSQLWSLGSSAWRGVGLGRSAVGDPLTQLLAVLAWPFGVLATPAGVVRCLLLFALPLAAGLAWWAAGALTVSRSLRAWAAVGWAVMPSLLVAVATGRVGAVLAHLLLPPTALAVARAVGAPRPTRHGLSGEPRSGRRPGSLAAASAGGLLVTALLAAAPSLAVPAVLGLVLAFVLARSGTRLRLLWAAVVPSVLLLPWWLAVAATPRLLLAEPGGASAPAAVLDGGHGVPGDVWRALLWPADPVGLTAGPVHRLAEILSGVVGLGDDTQLVQAGAVAAAVPVLLLGLLALNRDGRRGVVARGLWLLGLAGLLVALAAPLVDRRVDGGQVLLGWPGPGTSLLGFAVLAAAVTGLDGAADRLRARSVGWRHPMSVLLGAVAVVVPVVVLLAWTVTGWTVPDRASTAGREAWVHRGDADVMPAVAAAEAEGPAATRTLVLSVRAAKAGAPQQVSWSLLRDGGPRLGVDSAAAAALPARQQAAQDPRVLALISGLLSDGAADQRDGLADAGIGSVLLLRGSTSEATLALDTAPGLVRVARTRGAVLWRVEMDGAPGGPTRPARARIVGADGEVQQTLASRRESVDAQVPAGASGRLLVLAEHADDGWTATLNGRRLGAGTYKGWAQAFSLPAGGGHLVVRYADPLPQVSELGRLGVAGLAVLVALPLPRRRRRRPVSRRPAMVVEPQRRPAGRRRAEPTGAIPVVAAEPEVEPQIEPGPVTSGTKRPESGPEAAVSGAELSTRGDEAARDGTVVADVVADDAPLSGADAATSPAATNEVTGEVGDEAAETDVRDEVSVESAEEVVDDGESTGVDVSDEVADVIDESIDGTTGEAADDTTHDTTDGVSDEVADGVSDEVADEVVDGGEVSDEVTDGVSDEVTNGVSDEVTDDIAEEITDEAPDETSDETDEDKP